MSPEEFIRRNTSHLCPLDSTRLTRALSELEAARYQRGAVRLATERRAAAMVRQVLESANGTMEAPSVIHRPAKPEPVRWWPVAVAAVLLAVVGALTVAT